MTQSQKSPPQEGHRAVEELGNSHASKEAASTFSRANTAVDRCGVDSARRGGVGNTINDSCRHRNRPFKPFERHQSSANGPNFVHVMFNQYGPTSGGFEAVDLNATASAVIEREIIDTAEQWSVNLCSAFPLIRQPRERQ